MEILSVMKSRRSVRRYLDKPVPMEILKELVDCARLAPSGYNRQAWVFVVVTDPKLRNRIADVAGSGGFIRKAGACIAVFSVTEGGTPLEDACAATENIITAAGVFGLGTCWVNSHRKEHTRQIEAMLQCPPGMELMTLIAVGYPEEQPKKPSKKPLDEVMRLNTF